MNGVCKYTRMQWAIMTTSNVWKMNLPFPLHHRFGVSLHSQRSRCPRFLELGFSYENHHLFLYCIISPRTVKKEKNGEYHPSRCHSGHPFSCQNPTMCAENSIRWNLLGEKSSNWNMTAVQMTEQSHGFAVEYCAIENDSWACFGWFSKPVIYFKLKCVNNA